MSSNKVKHPNFTVVIVGCGNLAWHLAKRLYKQGVGSLKVFNHKKNAALQAFKEEFNAEIFSDFKRLPKTADFYFICVSDNAIPEVLKTIKANTFKGVVMHCAGAKPLSLLEAKIKQRAVFYPLQTFTKHAKIHWSEVPLIVEASSETVLSKVKTITALFSKHVTVLSHHERLQLHLAAVFANNFVNALFVEAYKLLPKVNDAHENLLLPLIQQTVSKLEKVHPLNAQTGPAKRHDKSTMDTHVQLLKQQPKLSALYKQLSELITVQQKHIHE